MRCAFYTLADEDDAGGPCDNEATHDRECTQGAAPVCASHKCRCSVTFEERSRRVELQRIPSHWMAL